MNRTPSRKFAVVFCFAIWLGAAALACGTFAPSQLLPETQPPTLTDPSAIVHIEAEKSPDFPAKVAVAER